MSQESIVVEPSNSAPNTPPVVEQKPTAPKLDEIKLPDDPTLDPTYRGKSAADLIEMHKNAQSRIGAQGQELGVWRGLVAELSQVTKQAPPTATQETALKITSDELLTNPAEAISKVVSHSLESALKPIKEGRELDRRELELSALNRDFPNFQQVGDDPEFVKWAHGAPGRRADAALVAKGDTVASRRLLEAWNDRQELLKGAQRPTNDSGKPQGVDGAKTVVTESGGGGRSAPTGKIFNRAEVVDLIINKPDVYASDAYQAELLQAAKEGRIR